MMVIVPDKSETDNYWWENLMKSVDKDYSWIKAKLKEHKIIKK